MRKRDVAEFFEVSVQAVDNWILAGCPVEKRDRRGRVKEMLIGEVLEWRHQHHRQDLRDHLKFVYKHEKFVIAGAMLAYAPWAARQLGIPEDKALEMMRLLTREWLADRSDLDDKMLFDVFRAA